MYHHGYFPEAVDHIDGDRFNNKIENLREATHVENHYNRKVQKNNKSGSKNVCWHKLINKWSVDLTVNKKIDYTYNEKKATENQNENL